jgi:hypothetical protein
MKLPRRTLLPFGARERVVNRQIRERAAGKKVRPGLGRPRKRRASSEDAVVAHTKRRVIAPKTAVDVTLSVTTKVPNLRTRKKYALVKRAFAAAVVRPPTWLTHVSTHMADTSWASWLFVSRIVFPKINLSLPGGCRGAGCPPLPL